MFVPFPISYHVVAHNKHAKAIVRSPANTQNSLTVLCDILQRGRAGLYKKIGIPYIDLTAHRIFYKICLARSISNIRHVRIPSLKRGKGYTLAHQIYTDFETDILLGVKQSLKEALLNVTY